jgi:hypothetical protein
LRVSDKTDSLVLAAQTSSQGSKMRRFKAGLVLEEEVSRSLFALGVPHRRTQNLGKEDVADRVDLVVPSCGGRDTLEFQITLRAKERGKIFAFALKALTTHTRGVRIYLEVVGARRKDDIARIAEKVARAIRTVVKCFRDFGKHALLGVRVNAKNAAIEKFDPVAFCGRRLLEAVARIGKITTKRPRRRPIVQCTLLLFAHAHSIVQWRHAAPRPSYYNPRAHFMPRKFC